MPTSRWTLPECKWILYLNAADDIPSSAAAFICSYELIDTWLAPVVKSCVAIKSKHLKIATRLISILLCSAGWTSRAFHLCRQRVFILGPAHHVHLTGCALSSTQTYKTPLYDLPIDAQGIRRLFAGHRYILMLNFLLNVRRRAYNFLTISLLKLDNILDCIAIPQIARWFCFSSVYADLHSTGQFDEMTVSTDEDEHSIEMQLPYIAKVMERSDWIVVYNLLKPKLQSTIFRISVYYGKIDDRKITKYVKKANF